MRRGIACIDHQMCLLLRHQIKDDDDDGWEVRNLYRFSI